MSKTIILRSAGQVFKKEAPANGAVTPGDFLERATDGDFQRQSTSRQKGPKLVALTNELEGKEITDSYASGDNVVAAYVQPGDEIYAFVPASAAAIVVGDALVFNGDGTLVKGTDTVALSTSDTYTDAAVNTAINNAAVVATALEAVDNSGGGSKARIRVEIV